MEQVNLRTLVHALCSVLSETQRVRPGAGLR
jgi:hypothetical protein